MSATPEELGEYAVHLARGAAELVGRETAGHAALHVASKSSSTDLVTDVDRASERWLVGRIAEDRPGDAVLGEEGGGRPGTSGVRWLVDPIDGTVNYVLGLPQSAVSVAAELDGAVVAGAVCNPVTGELFSAVRGGGAWLDGARLGGPRQVELSRAVIGTGFAYDRELRARQGAVVAALLPRIADIRRIGSAALDLCAVACGRLDGYFEVGLNPWDYGAGVLIATEAGCVAGGLEGRPVSGRMTVVAAPDLADALFALLGELGAADLGE
jgi:myo-inositol-1(or 4)-monophosphatase